MQTTKGIIEFTISEIAAVDNRQYVIEIAILMVQKSKSKVMDVYLMKGGYLKYTGYIGTGTSIQ